MSLVDEPITIAKPAVAPRSPDPMLAAFAASRIGLDCPPVRWDDLASPDALLEGALRAGGPEGRVVQLVLLDGRVVGAHRIHMLLGEPVPERTIVGAERLVEILVPDCTRAGVDLVVDGGRWWFGGLTVLPDEPPAVTNLRRAPAAAS
ncbi:hypothetical protein [Protaetiibacter intestinalis]|uniref:Uncharacterized protein n=1 Tax=Protaetiibacter intestinalis TaxID=2419774 RepID=A0A387BAZ5_9MICO|nr:hypothetical protein [Protaetiibacter intestinalis]AYF98109.1 hypothetical protein D7I47_07480 [Protaetiibacter intestinalis]